MKRISIILEKLIIIYHVMRGGEYAVFFAHKGFNRNNLDKKLAAYISYNPSKVFLESVSEYTAHKEFYDEQAKNKKQNERNNIQ